MKTEREMFEEWIENEDPFVGNDDNPDCIWAKKYMWNAWQASAQREGYKLVPVDLIERCISHIGIASCHPANNSEDDIQMTNDIDSLEKAMMGASE